MKLLRTVSLLLNTPKDFNFWRTVYSHGWCSLVPFSVGKEHQALDRLLTLSDGSLVHCHITNKKNSSLDIRVSSFEKLDSDHRSEIKQQIATCLRLTEDFTDFYRETQCSPKYQWIAKVKAGRMLRAPSVFEDVVKMICTTNCNWALTEIMVENLVGEFGKSFDDLRKSFPSPEALAINY